MMKQLLFRGMATALVTPMHPDGSVDLQTLARLTEWQIQSGEGVTSSRASAPAAAAALQFSSARAVSLQPAPAITGTRPEAVPATVRITVVRSCRVRVAASPVVPQG